MVNSDESQVRRKNSSRLRCISMWSTNRKWTNSSQATETTTSTKKNSRSCSSKTCWCRVQSSTSTQIEATHFKIHQMLWSQWPRPRQLLKNVLAMGSHNFSLSMIQRTIACLYQLVAAESLPTFTSLPPKWPRQKRKHFLNSYLPMMIELTWKSNVRFKRRTQWILTPLWLLRPPSKSSISMLRSKRTIQSR